jgi:hypothetical protein
MSTITTLNSTSNIGDDRSTINTNLANLNADKLESTDIDTLAELNSILTDATLVDIAAVGLVANPLSQFAATTSAQLAGVLSDETGTGAAVFGTSPAITTPTGIVKGDVGLGNVDNTSNVTERSATATLTNKTLDAATNSLTGTQANLIAGNVTTNANLTGGVTSVGNTATVATNANLTGHVTSTGNAAILGSFTVAQLSTALSDASISGTNTGDQTIPASGVDFDPVGTDNSNNNAVNTLYSGLVSNATHTGDVTGSTALTIAAGAVDLAMLSATGTASGTTFLRGDNTWATPAGGGAVDSVNTQTGVVVLDADDISDAATTNKFATAAELSAISANTAKVTNATHTGDVTGDVALTIAANTVTLAKMADMATASLLGRATAATGDPEVLSKASALALLNVEDGADVTDATNVGAALTLTGDVTSSGSMVTALKANLKSATLGITIDGAGSAITTGVKGYLEIPFDYTITQATLTADQSGSIVVDVWKDTYANYPPTDLDSITASAPPTITAAVKSQDSTLTGWTLTGAKGDVLGFNVDSITTITRATLTLQVTKT